MFYRFTRTSYSEVQADNLLPPFSSVLITYEECGRIVYDDQCLMLDYHEVRRLDTNQPVYRPFSIGWDWMWWALLIMAGVCCAGLIRLDQPGVAVLGVCGVLWVLDILIIETNTSVLLNWLLWLLLRGIALIPTAPMWLVCTSPWIAIAAWCITAIPLAVVSSWQTRREA
jgi:hypothetical protein